jgi:ssDNA-binding Zn-finger/Zn-ribbon topoisomerase 1
MKNITRSVDLPTGEAGLLPRECPHCATSFAIDLKMFEKHHYLNLKCPECNMISKFKKFHTGDQVDFARSVTGNEARRQIEDEIGDMLDDAFSGISGDFLEVKTNIDSLDMGRETLPSPHLQIKTEKVNCPDCGFKYAVEQGKATGSNCPVCR